MGGAQSYDYQAALFADTKPQSQVSKDAEGKDAGSDGGAPRRVLKDDVKEITSAPERDGEAIDTIGKCLAYSVKKHPDNKLYGTRKYSDDGKKRGAYVWESYKDIGQAVRDLGAGLNTLGQKSGSNVGIYAPNRTEWCVTAMTLFSNSLRAVALYDTLGAEAVAHIFEHAELEVVFCSKEKVKKVLEAHAARDNLPLKYIVQFDYNELYNNKHEKLEDDDRKACEDKGLKLLSFRDLIAEGAKVGDFQPVAPETDDIAFIMYTSGTTGVPKGAILTHKNLMSTVGSMGNVFPINPTDIHISYLPLAHIFETVFQIGFVMFGAGIGFFGGNVKTLSEDFVALQPTILCGVPRVFGKIYTKVMSQVDSGWFYKRWLFYHALGDSSNKIRHKKRSHTWDSIIWKNVAAKMGLGKVRCIVTGAAPTPPYLLEFFKIAVNCPMLSGYGLTETSAATAVSRPDDPTIGHNGPPLSCCEVKLESVEEMNYLVTDDPPTGEVLVRGPNVFKGYYKNDKATEEAFTDGWLHTGDVGRWNPNGTLSIIDRKKNIFKLAHGEYVASEKVEAEYSKAECVNQIFVYGNSYKPYVMAVVVPETEWLLHHLQQKGIKWNSKLKVASPEYREAFQKVCADNYDLVRDIILENLREYEKALKGFEKLKDIHVEVHLDELLQGFNVENECLTPSFKLRRPFLLDRYVEQLKALYTKHGEAPTADENWGRKK